VPDRDTNANERAETRSGWIVFGVAGTVVVGLCVAWGWAGYSEADTLGNRGLFGDSYGALNTLFSGLAFAGVIAALVMQMQELRLQRRELELQRREMEESRRELGRQADVLEQQAQLQLHSSLPLLRFASSAGRNGSQTVKFTNDGGTATSCHLEEVLGPDGTRSPRWSSDVLKKDETAKFEVSWEQGKDPGRVVFELSYRDVLGERRFDQYEHEPLGDVRFRRTPKVRDVRAHDEARLNISP